MFKIEFSPQYSDAELELSTQGSSLIINGDELDFSDMPNGSSYPAEAIDNPFVVGDVNKVDGVVTIIIALPYCLSNPPQSVTFPEPITVNANGRIPLPTDGVEDAA